MDKFGKSQSVARREDHRFLNGLGRYLEDEVPTGALRAFVFRSPVAHAEITVLDVSEAMVAEGVVAVLTAEDLVADGVELGMEFSSVPNRGGRPEARPMRPLLAKDRVRFVGEAVAVVIAETLTQARDAAELIEFDFNELDVKLDLNEGGAELHNEAPDNVAFDWDLGDEAACSEAFENAAHVVSLQVADNRIIVNSMEPRGCYAEMDGGRLHVAFSGQGVWHMKDKLAKSLHMSPEDIRVSTPDVGGGFGMKAMAYPEYYVVAHAARKLGRAVGWTSDRTEAMLSDNAGRDLTSLGELALDKDLKIQAYRVFSQANMGAYSSQFAQAIQTQLFSRVLMGVYDVQNTYLRVKGIYTNTTQVDAYRGAGRPEAIYVLERVLDRAARDLGVTPWELRRRNFIAPDSFPYKTATGESYDVGEFAAVLDKASDAADIKGFIGRKQSDARDGKLRGIGLGYYIESILGNPSESAKVEFREDGTAVIYVGTQSNGQGHETVYAQFLSDQTGIPADKIEVVQGDSDLIALGGGTGGSRSVTTQATATLATVEVMEKSFVPFLAEVMEVEENGVSFDVDRFRIAGSNEAPTYLDAAKLARVHGREDLLTHEARTTLPGRSFPNGAHFAEVVVDPETGVSVVDRYSVVDDFGNLINPMLAEGQVHGGIVQGIGQAMSEHVVYDDTGQLLTATFMDYAMPRACDVPPIGFETHAVPSTQNPMGMKGCGEAGTVGALAAVANAMQDALWDVGVRQADMPFTPLRTWEMIRNAGQTSGETTT